MSSLTDFQSALSAAETQFTTAVNSAATALVNSSAGTPPPPTPSGLTPPPGAVARGFTKNLLYTDFSSTGLSSIDLNNTGDASKQWFVQNSWPSGGWIGAQPTPANHFTAVTGGVQIAPSNNDANVSMMSIFGTEGAGFIGTMLDGGKGFYVEFTCAIDPTQGSAGSPHPSLWMIQPVWALYHPTASVPVGASTEIDVLELLNSSGRLNTNMAEWVAGTGNNRGMLNGSDYQIYGQLIDTNQHTYGCSVSPPSMNGGVDKRELWFDGAHLSAFDVTWSATGTCAQTTTPSVVGQFASSEVTPFALIIGGPIECLSKVQAWGLP